MPTINPQLQGKNGCVGTYEAYTAILLGGTLVVPNGSTVGASGLQSIVAAGAGALNCLGVASSDAVPASLTAANTTGTSVWDSGYPQIDTSVPDPTVAVYSDCVVPILYVAGAVSYGDRLKCGAAGTVAKWITGTDNANLIIGRCAQPGGTAGGVIALVRLYPL